MVVVVVVVECVGDKDRNKKSRRNWYLGRCLWQGAVREVCLCGMEGSRRGARQLLCKRAGFAKNKARGSDLLYVKV